MTTNARHLIRGICGLAAASFAIIAVTGTPSSPLERFSPLGVPTARAIDQLSPFFDCDELRAWYVRQTLPHVTAWGLDFVDPMITMYDGSVAARTDAPTASEVGNGPTGTNVQEAGVDEPDSAKVYRDDFVVSVVGRMLIVTDVAGATPTIVARVRLDADLGSSELLIVGDRAVVLSQGSTYDDGPIRLMYGAMTRTGTTSMTTLDLSDPADPRIVGQQSFTGGLSAAREHDGTIRLVLTQASVDLPFVQPGREFTERTALKHNKNLVRRAEIDAWLPHRLDRSGKETSALLECGEVQHPRTGSGLGTITVLTVDPGSGAIEKDAVTADGSLVYVSADRLYVATVDNGWFGWTDETSDGDTSSTVHAFALEGNHTSYVASGEVDGAIPDRWALSEYQGLLRVASTRGPSWNPSQTGITVLREGSGQLIPIGEVDGLGKREQITAVRWFGDLAVIVTFKQTDPLYTVDLSNPTAPSVRGELKITGFSRYLHPLGDAAILGVGQSASRSGRTKGSQVSTFDLKTTSRIQKLDLGASYSPVEDDARAFTYLPQLNVAVIPVTDWQYGTTQLVVVAVGVNGSLSVQQRIAVAGWGDGIRTLPLSEDRIAVTSGGRVRQVVALG